MEEVAAVVLAAVELLLQLLPLLLVVAEVVLGVEQNFGFQRLLLVLLKQ